MLIKPSKKHSSPSVIKRSAENKLSIRTCQFKNKLQFRFSLNETVGRNLKRSAATSKHFVEVVRNKITPSIFIFIYLPYLVR